MYASCSLQDIICRWRNPSRESARGRIPCALALLCRMGTTPLGVQASVKSTPRPALCDGTQRGTGRMGRERGRLLGVELAQLARRADEIAHAEPFRETRLDLGEQGVGLIRL